MAEHEGPAGTPKKFSLEKLLKHGVDPNTLSFEDPGQRRTLLCLSADEGAQLDDMSRVELLLSARADPCRCSENGSFPLQLAVTREHVPIARKLLQSHADVNQQDEKLVSPLHLAAYQDHPRLVQLLLMHRANANAVDRSGQPPLFFASRTDVIAALVEAEADVVHLNAQGQSVLHSAARNGAYEAIAHFTEQEDLHHMLDLQDERGYTPLHVAASQGHQAVVGRLMDLGADSAIKTNKGQSAMSLADAKDVDVAYYIYTRVTGGNKASWSEMAQNPVALTLAAVLGVACFLNRTLLWEFGSDLVHLHFTSK